MAAAAEYPSLMAAARDPSDLATLAFGGVLTHFGICGLDAAALAKLARRYFPGLSDGTADRRGGVEQFETTDSMCGSMSRLEFEQLLALLHDHRRDDEETNRWVAHAIATACAGENHLWEDMRLPDRKTLSALIRHYFPVLYHKNTGNLRWKKFFYKELCNRAETRLCKAPSCGVCSDYRLCFGEE